MNEEKFAEYLKSRFGIMLSEEFGIEEKTNKVYVYSKDLETLGLKWVHRRGFLAGKLGTIFGIKPSLDFTLVFGHLAQKNCATISDEEVARIFAGEDIPLKGTSSKCEEGLTILKNVNGMGVAIAFNKGGTLQSLVQKDRQIAKGQVF
jgi:NOL1/NOP2/fmu family ribosome biogenesis protein